MKPVAKQSDRKAAFTPLEKKPHPLGVVKKRGGGLRSHPSFLTGFTIIELMTVMSVIIILIGLLVPGLNALKQYARKVTQKNQFYAIEVALETFNAEWDGYPESRPGISGPCGATQLATAMVGGDLLGYDPKGDYDTSDLSGRRLYLPIGKANAYKLVDLYGPGGVGTFTGNEYVLCDVYTNVEHLSTGKLVGMPILYYKANTSKHTHNITDPDDLGNIYNYLDNHTLVALGMPWNLPSAGGLNHQLYNEPKKFYEMTVDEKFDIDEDGIGRPQRADSYILLSAGFDGIYGTDDDMFNF